MTNLVILGCGARKKTTPMRADQLYIGPVFSLHRQYAEKFYGGVTHILSARYGLVAADKILDPYEHRIQDMSRVEQRVWAEHVALGILKLTKRGDTIVVLAGRKYQRIWRKKVEQAGRVIAEPLAGLPLFTRIVTIKKALDG